MFITEATTDCAKRTTNVALRGDDQSSVSSHLGAAEGDGVCNWRDGPAA